MLGAWCEVLGAWCAVLGAGARCAVLVLGARCWCSVLGVMLNRRVFVTLALGVLLLVGGCRPKQPPIRVEGRTLVIENRTRQEWRNVTVTVNSYYRGGAASLAAGGELDAGLSSLTTGLGQRFNAARESVHTVEVRATDAAGNPVLLDWSDRK